MNSIVQQNRRRRHKVSSNMQARDAKLPLDVLFALDRMVVEVSMQLYNVPGRERVAHAPRKSPAARSVRQHFPSLLKRAA